MSVEKGAIAGAFVGAGIAIILLSLDHARLFSPGTNAVIEHLAFRLCPLYILGFANGMGSMTVAVIATILGNAILYGVAFAVLAALPTPFKQKVV